MPITRTSATAGPPLTRRSSRPDARRVAFRTLGCRLNQAETATLAGQFGALGFAVVAEADGADVLVIHSCAVTQAAEQEGLRYLRRARRRTPTPFVVFTGCATSVADAGALRRAGADLVVSQAEKARLPMLVRVALGDPDASPVRVLPRFGTTRALLKVQDGCDFRCAYCIVPTARGRPRSRPFAEILDEAAALAAAGHRELVVTGANIGGYRDGRHALPDLVQRLLTLRGVARVRLGSIEPGTVERALVDLAVAESGLCRTFHYPLQSGDAAILAAMGRRYTPAQYAATIEYTLARLPNASLGADIIAGFPGETDAAFAATRDLLARYPFSNLHVFPYSERPGTPAAAMEPRVPVALRRARARELVRWAAAQRAAFAAGWVGREVAVLVERRDRNGVARGWTGEYLEARIAGAPADAVGAIVRVTPRAHDDATLLGDWPAPQSPPRSPPPHAPRAAPRDVDFTAR